MEGKLNNLIFLILEKTKIIFNLFVSYPKEFSLNFTAFKFFEERVWEGIS